MLPPWYCEQYVLSSQSYKDPEAQATHRTGRRLQWLTFKTKKWTQAFQQILPPMVIMAEPCLISASYQEHQEEVEQSLSHLL